ncbi:MAG: long-chain fatty acid--CoA ligase [Pirellulales bacterium]|nr:long-chain fatty acid--CoA ligase [Pirellulales bacterium]
MSQLPSTLPSLFIRRVAASSNNVALHLLKSDPAALQVLTWNDLAQEVRRLAAGLRRAGVEPGDRVCQVSENRYEWIVVDLAVHLAGGVHVAIHASLSGPQIAFQIADSGSKIVIVSGESQVTKLLSEKVALPRGLKYFSFDPREQSIAGDDVLPFTELFAAVARDGVAGIEQEAIENVKATDLATILYTSGTTGEAKGVMLSHGNLVSNAIGSCDAFQTEAEDIRLCWLPLSHIFARTCDLYTWLVRGSQLGLAENREKIIMHCSQLRPTLMNGVPYFFEKVKRSLVDAGKVGPAEPGGPTHLQRLLGGRIRACCSGGAALPNHVAEFFWQEGVPLVQGYGLTESSPVITTGTPSRHKLGTVGQPIKGVEVKIADDGEILTRGPHVMLGYWNRADATTATMRDGWLQTGDLGSLDADGYLRITGRKKEIIVTAGGKNIAPVYLESLLTQDPLVAQAIVIGDNRKYLTALIVPNPDALRAEIISRHLPVISPAEALAHPSVLELYRERIDSRLAEASDCEQIQRFKLLPRGFTMEQEELTPTLKLRRKMIHEHFAAEIETLYSDLTLNCGTEHSK